MEKISYVSVSRVLGAENNFPADHCPELDEGIQLSRNTRIRFFDV